MRVKIVVHVPADYANEVRAALGAAGAGELGDYTYCSFTIHGMGRFLPSEAAQPHTGTPGVLEIVEEERIEVTCEKEKMAAAIRRIRDIHPYEEPSIDVYELLDVNDLQ